MSHIGKAQDWAECNTCGWAKLGSWAHEEAVNHRDSQAKHEVEFGTLPSVRFLPNGTGCATCDAVNYLRLWIYFDAADRELWDSWDGEEEDPPGAEAQFSLKPSAPQVWLSGIGDFADDDPIEMTQMVRHLQCGKHETTNTQPPAHLRGEESASGVADE